MIVTIAATYLAKEVSILATAPSMSAGLLSTSWESVLSLPKQTYPSLDGPENQTLRKLKLYIPGLQSEKPDSLMLFARIPNSTKKGKEYAEEIASNIREYASYGYSPVIIFEPSLTEFWATLGNIKTGEYDAAIEALFATLRDTYHVSEKELGLVVPYPEINTPAFSRKDFYPKDFSTIVNRFFSLARKYYPTLRGSILLEGKTYTGDNWEEWGYYSFAPYLEGIDTNYIQSFWIQGFPWMSEERVKFFNFRTFLPKSLIDEASILLKTKNIWINTGTIGSMYSQSNSISSLERTQILNGLLLYMRYLKLKWYRPFVHIFSQNNLTRDDDFTDWSYLQSSEQLKVFADFLRKAHRSWIKVGFYDE